MRHHLNSALSSLVLVTAGLLALGSAPKKGDDDKAADTKTSSASVAEKAPVAKAAAPAAKVGDTVKFDDSEWVILEAKTLGAKMAPTSPFGEPAKTDGKFVYVRFKVKNLGNKQETIFDHPKVVDAKGREFDHYQQQYSYLPKGVKGMALEQLPASMTKEFGAVYEIPADATALVFQARALEIAGERKNVALGL